MVNNMKPERKLIQIIKHTQVTNEFHFLNKYGQNIFIKQIFTANVCTC